MNVPFDRYWPVIFFAAAALAVVTSAHAILNKRDVRAATGWSGLIWFSPVIGSILYVVLGVNRIRDRARSLRAGFERRAKLPATARIDADASELGEFRGLSQFVGRVVSFPLTGGNRIDALINGEQAYPAMLHAIRGARQSVYLASYIFDSDSVGLQFLETLEAAVKRGVSVRVLVDGIGEKYSRPRITKLLERRGVSVARFLGSMGPRHPYVNLRSHRKILVVDGVTGFTGGMNIRAGCLVESAPADPVQDLHFRVEGPVVQQLTEIFAEDWEFTTGENLGRATEIEPLSGCGATLARGIPDGPDEDLGVLQWTLLGALSEARRSVRIATPYFLPEQPLITALNVAAMRGVEVEILLPAAGNLRAVQWASTAQLWQVLKHGCRIWLTPPPFDHTKLMIVDEGWTLFGSGNWDPRSLRLNFEFNVECYDASLARQLGSLLDDKKSAAREITLDEVDRRPLPIRLRDSTARLFLPYL